MKPSCRLSDLVMELKKASHKFVNEKTEADYREALKRLDVNFDAAIGTPESDEANILGLIVD